MAKAVDKRNPIPRYLQVRQILESDIRSGRYSPGARLPGERDLAVEFDVSQMTVNKAIQAMVRSGWLRREVGNGTFVRESLQIPGPKTATIGFAIPVSTTFAEQDYYLGSLLRGVQRELVNRPISLKVVEAPKNRLYDVVMESPIDGCILLDVLDQSLEDVRRLAAEGLKTIILSANQEPVDVPLIDSDNASGTRTAVEHLLDLGHRRIAGAFAYLGMSDSRQRLSAFEETLAAHGVPSSEDLIFDLGEGEPVSGALRERLLRLPTSGDSPTAVLCGGFYVALEVLRLAREAGLHVPRELSIVGFDDPLAARYLTPPLTTVRQPLEEMGACAIDHLCRWLLQGREPPMHTVLPETFIVRDSTAPAP